MKTMFVVLVHVYGFGAEPPSSVAIQGPEMAGSQRGAYGMGKRFTGPTYGVLIEQTILRSPPRSCLLQENWLLADHVQE